MTTLQPSQTAICNRALQILGALSITAITDNSRNARQCLTCYDAMRRKELRRHNWNFSILRVILAPNAKTPAFDYQYAYNLPADCLRALKPNNPPDPLLDWQIENRMILTNNYGPTLNLRYVRDFEVCALMDPLFQESLACTMAEAMCEAITQSTAKQATAKEYRKDALAEAKRINAYEQIPVEGQMGSWEAARLTGINDVEDFGNGF